jgi:hypothetical protein
MADKFDPDKRVYYVDQGDGTFRTVPETAYNVNPVQSALIGAGKTFTDIGRGVRDLFGSETAAAEQAESDQLLSGLEAENPVSSIIGQALPYLASAPLGGASVAGQTALAAGTGALRQTGGFQDRALTGAREGAFGFAGAATGNLASRAVNGVRGVYQNKLAGQLIKQGGRVTPGQAIKGQAGGLDSTMDSLGAFKGLNEVNQDVIQGQVSRSIGQKTVDLSEVGLGDAAEDIGARMDSALEGLDIAVPEEAITRINNVVGENPFLNLPDDLQQMSGRTYQQVRRQLTDVARTEARSASPTAGKLEYVSDTIEQLDEAFAKVARPNAAKELRTAREQYRNLITAERGQAVTADGLVNPRTLRNNINKTYPAARRGGEAKRTLPATQELIQGARTQASKGLQPLQNSGTANRLGLGLGLPALVGGATYLGGDDSDQAFLAALSAYALSKGYGRAGNLIAGAPSALAAGTGRALGQSAAQ